MSPKMRFPSNINLDLMRLVLRENVTKLPLSNEPTSNFDIDVGRLQL